jgi:hypothetical protein
VSWQAVRAVVLHGPDDDKLYRLLNTIAETCDSSGGDGRIGLRMLAERCRVSAYRARRLVEMAVRDEWLVVVELGGGRRRTVYNLGTKLVAPAVARGIPRAPRGTEREIEPLARDIERGKNTRTVNGLNGAGVARSRQGGDADLAARDCPDCYGYGRVIDGHGTALVCAHPRLS